MNTSSIRCKQILDLVDRALAEVKASWLLK